MSSRMRWRSSRLMFCALSLPSFLFPDCAAAVPAASERISARRRPFMAAGMLRGFAFEGVSPLPKFVTMYCPVLGHHYLLPDARAQDPDPRRRRRPAPARPAGALPRRRGLRGQGRARRPRHGQAARPRALRPGGARPDAARRGRSRHLPAAARPEQRAGDHHADREGRRGRSHRRPRDGRRRLPAQAVQSARAARPHQRRAAAARPLGAAGRAGFGHRNPPLRPLRAQPRHAHPDARGQGAASHHRRVLGAQGPGAAPARAAVARQADGARPGPRVRGVRPLDRRADLAAEENRRGRSVASEAYPDGVGLRLRFRPGQRNSVTLFARSFLLIALLIVTAVLASFQIYLVYEREPRSRELAQQTVSVINLTRAALVSADPFRRRQLLIDLNESEGLRVYPATLSERLAPLPGDPLLTRVAQRVRAALGENTRFAYARDGEEGFWVSFFIDSDEFWAMLPLERFAPALGLQWLGWGLGLLALALAGAWLIAFGIARPLAGLTRAAGRLGRGEPHQPVPEEGARELLALAAAFNRMASDLADMERERAMVLAGISHDLRTPLSRLRLMLEMSGAESTASEAMSTDIDEIDAVIGQFLDFARSETGDKSDNDLNELLDDLAGHYARLGRKVSFSHQPMPTFAFARMAVRLAIVERVARAHSGMLQLLPREGGGLTARLSLSL